MIRSLMLFFAVLFFNNFLHAQEVIEVKGTGSGIYVEHTVAPKESFYSIGRLYNLPANEIAVYNHLKMADGLKIGQALHIPLVKENFTQTGETAKTEALVPVFHTVAAGETLYRLGVNYNKVSQASLKTWNHLASDEITAGTPVIIGFLKVDKNLSALAKKKFPAITAPAETTVQKAAPAAAETAANAVPPSTVPAEVRETPAAKAEETTTAPAGQQAGHFSGGYFKDLYAARSENKMPVKSDGMAGVFKSMSGWQDGKYYCFYNQAVPGTVLKITERTSGKTIYAKVLDAVPDIKQNSGLLVVISNAGAEELGVGDTRFDCTVTKMK